MSRDFYVLAVAQLQCSLLRPEYSKKGVVNEGGQERETRVQMRYRLAKLAVTNSGSERTLGHPSP